MEQEDRGRMILQRRCDRYLLTDCGGVFCFARRGGMSGISREQILGASRSRYVSKAKKLFFVAAHESGGATFSMLGRLTGRSHVAVKLAIEQIQSERNGKLGVENE